MSALPQNHYYTAQLYTVHITLDREHCEWIYMILSHHAYSSPMLCYDACEDMHICTHVHTLAHTYLHIGADCPYYPALPVIFVQSQSFHHCPELSLLYICWKGMGYPITGQLLLLQASHIKIMTIFLACTHCVILHCIVATWLCTVNQNWPSNVFSYQCPTNPTTRAHAQEVED